MKWEVKTKLKTHHIETVSSKEAVDCVRKTDNSEIIHVKLLPKTVSGKIKRFLKNFRNN
jgi:acyl-coenzyme A synthetase/AMP-(fatty) acid ligase